MELEELEESEYKFVRVTYQLYCVIDNGIGKGSQIDLGER